MGKTDIDIDKWQDILSSYVVGASLTGKLLYEGPIKSFLENLVSTVDICSEWPFQGRNMDTDEGVNLLNKVLLDVNKMDFKELEDDYNSLFVGPTVLAVPWESVYKTVDKTIFGESTAKVRKFYVKYGFKVPKLLNEPEDHIGLELLFLSHLCTTCMIKIENDRYDELKNILQDIKAFLVNHLLSFGFNCLNDIEKNSKTDFFLGIAKLTKGILQASTEDFVEV